MQPQYIRILSANQLFQTVIVAVAWYTWPELESVVSCLNLLRKQVEKDGKYSQIIADFETLKTSLQKIL